MSGVFDHVRGANVVIDRELRLAECVVVHGRRREVGAWEGGHTPCGQEWNSTLSTCSEVLPTTGFLGLQRRMRLGASFPGKRQCDFSREKSARTKKSDSASWPLASPISYSQHQSFSREKPVDGRAAARHFHERAGDTDRAHGCYDEHEHRHPRGDRRGLGGACLDAAVRALPRRALSRSRELSARFPAPFPSLPTGPRAAPG